jgi:hypothetical protein
MWKKLFYGASKQVANDVSRAVGKEMKKKMVTEKEHRLALQYRADTISEHQNDPEFQETLREINEKLLFLINTNDVCNRCIEFLSSPVENLSVIDLVITDLEPLKEQVIEWMEFIELENEYYQRKTANTVQPLVSLNSLMFGNGEEDELGVFGLYIAYLEAENLEVQDIYEEIFPQALKVINDLKENIQLAFIEEKAPQIISYYAYGVSDEIDFGNYTVGDLV